MERKLHDEYLSKFRFTEYHEPLKRWPFDVDDKIAAKIRKHGSFPKLLLEKSATKGKKLLFYVSQSNFLIVGTPSSSRFWIFGNSL